REEHRSCRTLSSCKRGPGPPATSWRTQKIGKRRSRTYTSNSVRAKMTRSSFLRCTPCTERSRRLQAPPPPVDAAAVRTSMPPLIAPPLDACLAAEHHQAEAGAESPRPVDDETERHRHRREPGRQWLAFEGRDDEPGDERRQQRAQHQRRRDEPSTV